MIFNSDLLLTPLNIYISDHLAIKVAFLPQLLTEVYNSEERSRCILLLAPSVTGHCISPFRLLEMDVNLKQLCLFELTLGSQPFVQLALDEKNAKVYFKLPSKCLLLSCAGYDSAVAVDLGLCLFKQLRVKL